MTLPPTLPIEPLTQPFDVSLRPPGSKSLTNRALLLAALAEGTSKLSGVLFADDSRRMLEALEALGFGLEIDEDACTVAVTGSGGTIPADTADLMLGNAGTATRFLTAALTLGRGPYVVDGIARMRERPIGELVAPLRELDADIDYLGEEGFPPLRIQSDGGPPTGGSVRLAPTLSSQFISALLIAAPYFDKGLKIKFDGDITSLPYVRMTLKLIKQFGGSGKVGDGYRRMSVKPGGYTALDYAVEPDASNASYFLAAAAVTPGAKIVIEGLGSESLQGDADFCDVLGRMGCDVQQLLHKTVLKAPASGRLRGVDVDLNDMPDMAQTLAVVALFAEGETAIRNVGNLRVKETDRMAALENELTRLGATVDTIADDLIIHPPAGGLTPAAVDTYDDHRMAMAFAVAGLRSPGVVINDPACVEKTFPDYFAFLDRLRPAAAPTP